MLKLLYPLLMTLFLIGTASAQKNPAPTTETNLKQIGLASINYALTLGYCPVDLVDGKGTPILSWRVAILPFVLPDDAKLKAIYEKIDLSKSWDDPVNKKLWAEMPGFYNVTDRKTKPGMTLLQMPTSKTGLAIKQPGLFRRFPEMIPDGTSNTILVVEARDSVNWMKPDDVTYEGKTVPKLGTPKRMKVFALFADGAVRPFARRLEDAMLAAMLSPSGGEPFDSRELEK